MGDAGGRTVLEHLAWPQVPDRSTLVLPLGSTEQHGPHLPAGTDAFVAEAVAAAVVEAPELAGRVAALVGPTVRYGVSTEHEGFAGTVSITPAALSELLLELGRSACRWAERLLVVNAHGGNLPTVRDVVLNLRAEGHQAAWVPCTLPSADSHAGRFETSLMLAIAPWSVRMPLARPPASAPGQALVPRLGPAGTRPVYRSGVVGDPTGASAQEGRNALRAMAEDVVGRLLRWSPDPAGMLTSDPIAGRDGVVPGFRA